MSDILNDAVLRSGGDGAAACDFTLEVAQPPAEVWRALTEPDGMVQWLAPGTIEPRPGGAVRIDFEVSGAAIDSVVSAWSPERRLAYSWSGEGQPARPVEWRIAPAGDGSVIGLTVAVPAGENAAVAFAGWSAHLQMLGAALAGAPIAFPGQHFRAAREALTERLAAG
ncbi:MAG: SRPBCC domain-containing protein [Caulobacteraceae bacterium]|nr:SRPBCC domain-containing protein [Caulobacteraceae bacterium]